MPTLHPFRALRYDPHVVSDVQAALCPPYDVISPAQRTEYQRQSPHNAVFLELPEGPVDGPQNRYTRAAATLGEWLATGALKRDPRAAYYLHETRMADDFAGGGARIRRDLLAALALEPWASGGVMPHEHTLAGPKADRLALLRATRANLSPIWVLHRERHVALEQAWAAAQHRQPAADLAYQGEQHRLWLVDDPAEVASIQRAFAEGGPLYIADGHHRYETALAYSQEAAEGGDGAERSAGAQATLVVVTHAEDPGLAVLATHRVLRQVAPGLTPDSLRAAWSDLFDLAALPPPGGAPLAEVAATIQQRLAEAAGRTAFVVLGPGPDALTLLAERDPALTRASLPRDRSPAWRALDLALLHTVVLEALVSGAGLARDENLWYTRDPREAVAAVRAGTDAMAFFVNPTPVEQVLAVADARDRMPEKSTYFSPKPPTGLLIRTLADA